MKKSELQQIIREEIANALTEAAKYDTLAVLSDFKRYNNNEIQSIDDLVIRTIKNLGYKPTANNIKQAESHLSASMTSNDKLPIDATLVRELMKILR